MRELEDRVLVNSIIYLGDGKNTESAKVQNNAGRIGLIAQAIVVKFKNLKTRR